MAALQPTKEHRPQRTPLFLKRDGVWGREKLLFPRKEFFPSPKNNLLLLKTQLLHSGVESAAQSLNQRDLGSPVEFF